MTIRASGVHLAVEVDHAPPTSTGRVIAGSGTAQAFQRWLGPFVTIHNAPKPESHKSEKATGS